MAICIYHSFVQLPVLQRKSLGKNKCPYKGGPTVAVSFCCFLEMVQFMFTTIFLVLLYTFIYSFRKIS